MLPKPFMLSLLATALVFVGCSSDGGNGTSDGGSNSDAVAQCSGATSGDGYEVPAGRYRGTLKARDTATCGIGSTTQSEEPLLEVEVTDTSITLDPGKAAQVSIIRTGNKLCGTSTREFQHTTDGQTCILDETDTINGEVTAKGKFWVDLDFDWKQKGGICTALTLPCSGKVTWEFVIGGYDVQAGPYSAEVTEVRGDTCNTNMVPVGAPTSSYLISATNNSFSYCPGGGCVDFDRWADKITYSGNFDWDSPKCAGTEKIEGEITSPTTFKLVRTRETASSCSQSCKFVFVMEFTYTWP